MKKMIKSSSMGEYVGRRLLTDWTVSLLVYGAEESEFFDLEQSFTGNFLDCIKKAKEYFKILKDNDADGYVTLEANRSGEYFELYDIYDLEDQFPEELDELENITSSNYVPDMTQRYPEGERGEGYIEDFDSMFHDDYEEILVEDAIKDADHFFGGDWNELYVYDIDGKTYFATPDTIDDIPEEVMTKPVDYYDWNSIKNIIWIWVFDSGR